MNAALLKPNPLWKPDELYRPETVVIHGERMGLWTPDNFPRRPVLNERGDVMVIRPFDVMAEIEKVAREAWKRKQCEALGVPYIAGGAAGSWTFANGGRTSLLNGTFDLDSDTFKMALLLSTSNIGASSTTHAGVTNEHSNANGYTTGGNATALSLSGTTTVTVDCTDEVWTASGGSIVARFGEIYEVSGNVLCYCLLDSTPADVTATAGNTLTIAINASGVFTLA